jgi:hypothetical protein
MRDTTKKPRSNWRPFEEARIYVHSLGLRNEAEWQAWSKSNDRPDDIPKTPDYIYKGKGWANWGDWLGTGTIAAQNRIYLPFEEARTFARSLGLKSRTEWRVWSRSDAKPDDIPANPAHVYKNKGWVGWGDWLGTGTIAPQKRIYLPFEEARTFVRSLELKSQTQWRVWSKSDAKPDDIPGDPPKIYKAQGWVSWGDWLGTGSIAPSYRIYLPFEEARAFARSLGLKKQTEWRVCSKSDAKPDNIPADPYNAYKDKG